MIDSILEAHKQGIVIYGECGGMMYLMEKLIDCAGRSFNMSGVLNGTSMMENRRQGLGYVIVEARCDNVICNNGDTFRAHEFHWSKLQDIPDNTIFAYKTRKSNGNRAGVDGICKSNVMASYTHIHFSSNSKLAINLLSSMAKRSGRKFAAERM
jgi:cobyrinic acid a,c-diamide synthase